MSTPSKDMHSGSPSDDVSFSACTSTAAAAVLLDLFSRLPLVAVPRMLDAAVVLLASA